MAPSYTVFSYQWGPISEKNRPVKCLSKNEIIWWFSRNCPTVSDYNRMSLVFKTSCHSLKENHTILFLINSILTTLHYFLVFAFSCVKSYAPVVMSQIIIMLVTSLVRIKHSSVHKVPVKHSLRKILYIPTVETFWFN